MDYDSAVDRVKKASAFVPSKGGLVPPSAIWRQATQAQLAKFRKLVEAVKAEWEVEEGEPEYYGAIKACDDILKKLEEVN